MENKAYVRHSRERYPDCDESPEYVRYSQPVWLKKLDNDYSSLNQKITNITKWSRADDKRLERLISFIHHNPNVIQFCYVGDQLKDCHLVMYVDAGFAGKLAILFSTCTFFGCVTGIVLLKSI